MLLCVLIFRFLLLQSILTQYGLTKSREPNPCGLVTSTAIKGGEQLL